MYKAKVGLTTFLLKLVLRRMLGRVFVRSMVASLLPFVAVPVTAGWNAFVTWWVLRESRLRAMGPSAIEELVQLAFKDVPGLSAGGRIAAMRAVAASIVSTQDLHPNLLTLLNAVAQRCGAVTGVELDNVDEFLKSLPGLHSAEQQLAMRLLAAACIVDGRLTRQERALYLSALAAAGRRSELGPLRRLQRAFVHGDGGATEALNALG